MAENKKSFLLYCDLIHTVKKMPKDKVADLFIHILKYVNDENPITEDLIIELTFEPIKQYLKRDLEKYKATCLKNSDNVKKRWNKENTTVYDRILSNTNYTDSDSDSDIDNDSDKDILLKKETKNEIFNFKKKLIEYGFDENLVSEWLQVRKNKKATNTETSFKKFISEIEKRDCDLNMILETIVANSWSGFSWIWIDNLKNQKTTNSPIEKEQMIGRTPISVIEKNYNTFLNAKYPSDGK